MHIPIAWISWIVFALTYLGLAIGRVPGTRMDRAAIALVGATLMLGLGVLTLREAVAADSIDYETLLLLFGMMVLVGFLRLSGVFIRLANVLLARIRTPRVLLAIIIVLSGVLSAFLVNDVVCVAITPLILHLVQKLKFDPLPQLIGLATAANIGSVATITGNPQNMIIGMQSQISYLDFALHLAPIALFDLLVDFFLIALIYRKRLAAKPDPGPAQNQPDNAKISAGKPVPHQEKVLNRPIHRWLQIKSVIVAIITVILFFTGLTIALIAIGAAAVLLIDRIKSEKIYRRIDWSLLLMFIGLFVVVHAFQLQVVSGWNVAQWSWLQAPSVTLLSLASAALSNLVSNVPAVLLFEPVMHAIAPAAQSNAWLTLAMSSTLAGNLTILGSVANLIVVESARREGVTISFREYSRVGVPLTLLTLAIGIAWLQFVHY